MEQTKEYFAFISYKREDEKWAKWLQHKLEHYRLPTNVRKDKPSLPQNIRPVFKDTSELGAGVLADEIHEALENSKYLIVICSPRAAQSQWVGKEVQTFIDMGRSDKIIPFIIGGKPFSEIPEEECFPSALLNLPKEQELLGVNINEMGRDAAVVKVVARMFDLKFDTLWQRYEREVRRRRNWIIAVIAAFVFVVLGIAVYIGLLNIQLEKERNVAVKARQFAEQQRDRAEDERLRANTEQKRAEQAEDNIRIQNDSIKKTNRDLAKTIAELKEANYRIIQERNGMLAAQSRAVAEKSVSLVNSGDFYTARVLALAALPQNLSYPDRPYTPEAEMALRTADQELTIIKPVPIKYDSKYTVLSPDGKYLALTNGNSIHIWDVSQDSVVCTFAGHKNSINTLSFSNNGKYIVTTSKDSSICIWDISSKAIWREFSDHKIFTDCVNINSDGSQMVSVSNNDSIIRIWDTGTGNVKFIKDEIGKTHFIAFSPDDKKIVSISKGKRLSDEYRIKVWDIATAQLCYQIPEGRNYMKIAEFCPNGKYLFIANYNNIKIYNAQDGSFIKNIAEHTGNITSIRFSLDNNLMVSTSDDLSVRVWDMHDFNLLKTYIGHSDKVTSAAFCNDSNIISISNDKTIRLWKGSKHPYTINNAYYNLIPNSNKILTWGGGDGDTIAMFDLQTGELLSQKQTGIVLSTALSPDGKILHADICETKKTFTKTLYYYYSNIFHTSDFSLIKKCKTVDSSSFLGYSHNGQIIVRKHNKNNTLLLIDAHSGNLRHTLPAKLVFRSRFCFSPDDSELISTSSNGLIYIWDTNNGSLIYSFKLPSQASSVSFSPDGRYVAFSTMDGCAYVIDAQTWEIIHSLPQYTIEKSKYLTYKGYVTFSPNGKFIVATCMNDAFVWDTHSGRLLYKLFHSMLHEVGAGTPSCDIANVSPDNKYILTTSSNKLYVWDASSGKLIQMFVHDGKRSQVGNQITYTLNYLNSATFSNDGKHIISQSSDGSIKIWDFPPLQQLIDNSRNMYRDWILTPEERQKYYLE